MIRAVMRFLSAGMLVVLLLGVVASCSDDTEVAEELPGDANTTPEALEGLPEGVEVAELTIRDGEFVEDSLSATAERPVDLRITNEDDETYSFAAGDVITETEIPAGSTTGVEFNAPEVNEYEGQLLGPDGEVLDTIFFEVSGPGGL